MEQKNHDKYQIVQRFNSPESLNLEVNPSSNKAIEGALQSTYNAYIYHQNGRTLPMNVNPTRSPTVTSYYRDTEIETEGATTASNPTSIQYENQNRNPRPSIHHQPALASWPTEQQRTSAMRTLIYPSKLA